MIGHRARLRDVMGQSYPIYAFTRSNNAPYSSDSVTLCGSWKHSLLNNTWEKHLTGRNCQAYETISFRICREITPCKTTWA